MLSQSLQSLIKRNWRFSCAQTIFKCFIFLNESLIRKVGMQSFIKSSTSCLNNAHSKHSLFMLQIDWVRHESFFLHKADFIIYHFRKWNTCDARSSGFQDRKKLSFKKGQIKVCVIHKFYPKDLFKSLTKSGMRCEFIYFSRLFQFKLKFSAFSLSSSVNLFKHLLGRHLSSFWHFRKSLDAFCFPDIINAL